MVNWAIGTIGRRQQTAILFDTEPKLPEETFDSHGIPVAPQSLYLAQLVDRLGTQVLQNIGYSTTSASMFTNKSIQPSPPLKIENDPILGQNLALHHPVNTSNVRGETRDYGGEKAIDGNNESYWSVDVEVTRATITIDTEGPAKINTVEIGEASGKRNRIKSYKIDGQVDNDWRLLSEGTTIGERKIEIFPETTIWKVRFTILEASDSPAINKIGLYLAQ